jgi:hypothetical protein
VKARLALLLVVVAAAVVVAAVLIFPAARPPAPPAPGPSPPKPTQEGSPREVVVTYLDALERRDFQAAYDRLSRASQTAHSYDEFVSLSEESGLPSYDLSAAEEKPGEGGWVTLMVPLVEDVAQAGFTTVKEDGAWKVIFIGGTPGFPYP